MRSQYLISVRSSIEINSFFYVKMDRLQPRENVAA